MHADQKAGAEAAPGAGQIFLAGAAGFDPASADPPGTQPLITMRSDAGLSRLSQPVYRAGRRAGLAFTAGSSTFSSVDRSTSYPVRSLPLSSTYVLVVNCTSNAAP